MLRWPDAKALIEEAKKLKYRFTSWEREVVSRLEIMQPKFVSPADEKTLTTMYRRAAGGEKIQRGGDEQW